MPSHRGRPAVARIAPANRPTMSPTDGTELADELASYAPADAREAAMRDELVAFLRRSDAPFSRETVEGHVTGSAWIVDRAGASAVLLHHRKLGRWLQPGGHADGDPDVRAVARREADEETGLRSLVAASAGVFDVDVHHIPARGDEPAHEHYDVRYAFYADRAEAPRGNDESHAVRWIALDELDRYSVDDSVRRLATKTARLDRAGGSRR